MSFEKKVFAGSCLVLLFFFVGLPGFAIWRFVVKQTEPPKPFVREELTITIIPGWNLRNVADYLVKQGITSSTKEVFFLTGDPGDDSTFPFQYQNSILSSKGRTLSLEGYLAPETFRVFKDAVLGDVIKKLIEQREKEFEKFDLQGRSVHEVLTMASMIEDEARTLEDRKLVSDIMWRRLGKGWALQLDSTVHYAVNKTGTVFTTKKDRESDSPWNTYKYVGLPPGPINNPSTDSIDAALNPTKNDYWYFLSGNDGKMHYAKTLDEHNLNRVKYLR